MSLVLTTLSFVQLFASLRTLSAQVDRIATLQADLSNVDKLKAELEEAKKYNISLVNDRAAEKLKATGAISLFESKSAELEQAKKEKSDVERRVQALVEEKKKLSNEVLKLKEEKEQISVQLEEVTRRAEEAAKSLEGLQGRDAKIEIMRKWFASRRCEVRDLYLGEQIRYKMMDLAVKRILDRHPHLDVSDIDLKMNPDDANEPSYFYGMGSAPQMFTYEHTLDFTYPEDESADEGEEEEDGDGEENCNIEGVKEVEDIQEVLGTSPGPYAGLDNIIPASDISMENADTSPQFHNFTEGCLSWGVPPFL